MHSRLLAMRRRLCESSIHALRASFARRAISPSSATEAALLAELRADRAQELVAEHAEHLLADRHGHVLIRCRYY